MSTFDIIMANPGVLINGPWPMPNPCDKEDLHFKGKHINLFLSKYECYADRAHLTEVQRCEDLRLYFSKQEKRVLDILKGYQNRNWSQLIEELLLLYTSSSELYIIALHEEKSRWKDPRSEFEDLRVTDSPAFEPQSDSIPELASLPSLCDMCRDCRSSNAQDLLFGYKQSSTYEQQLCSSSSRRRGRNRESYP